MANITKWLCGACSIFPQIFNANYKCTTQQGQVPRFNLFKQKNITLGNSLETRQAASFQPCQISHNVMFELLFKKIRNFPCTYHNILFLLSTVVNIDTRKLGRGKLKIKTLKATLHLLTSGAETITKCCKLTRSRWIRPPVQAFSQKCALLLANSCISWLYIMAAAAFFCSTI